jgi:hypothetical protein
MRFDNTAPWMVRLTKGLRDQVEPFARRERREPAQFVRLLIEESISQKARAAGLNKQQSVA